MSLRSFCERNNPRSPVESLSLIHSSKPCTALASPWPAPTVLPRLTQDTDCGDYESELVIVIGKEAKIVSELESLHYVLGYTAANDISSRTSQFEQSQWCFSKGFDGSCPIGKMTYLLDAFISFRALIPTHKAYR